MVVMGPITSVQDFGAFVSLESGLDGDAGTDTDNPFAELLKKKK